jgi:hypothetical protein
MKKVIPLLLFLAVWTASGGAISDPKSPKGLNPEALAELDASGVNKYLGQYTPMSSSDAGDGWTKHTFNPMGGAGPICIAGTPFSVFTREGKSSKLLIMEQGGGACWQDFYNCNVLSEAQEPPAPPFGIWDFGSKDNPFKDHSIVYMPYCDGSVFTGDNDVLDPAFGPAIGWPGVDVRFHRGLRNQSAGMDVAKAMFPKTKKITVAGSSAGGVGIAGFAPFLVRMVYGNKVDLTVFNDAGPITANLNQVDDVMARAADWDFGKFYPDSCTECDDMGQGTAIIHWRLDNDSTVREAFYETDSDLTNRFFLGLLYDQPAFRSLIVTEHGKLNAAHPDRYKRFIVAGDTSHTALQSPLFYIQSANGVVLNKWTKDFLKSQKNKKGKKKSKKSKKSQKGWIDIVEDPVP